MDWNAAHADYVIAAYVVAALVLVWCVATTWLAYRGAKDKA